MADTQDLTALSEEDLKKKRRVARMQVTALSNQIEQIIRRKGSKSTLQQFIDRISAAANLGSKVNDLLTNVVAEEEAEEEYHRQLEYEEKAIESMERAHQHLMERADEAPSIVPSLPNEIPGVADGGGNELMNAEDASRGQQSEAEQIRRLEEEIRRLKTSTDVTPPATVKKQDPNLQVAPDSWIDDYVNGQVGIEWWGETGQPARRKDLEIYDGSALKWFSWIDLFKSLVHDSASSTAEKMAILRSKLQGDCAELVYGLGGGEDAYREAISRLKLTCGRRDVMRAAHLGALDRLEPGKGPSNLKRFAERVRNHLFDLSRIGENTNPDIIEKITAKLSLHDRLAWHEAKLKMNNQYDLGQFGKWLCDRAAAYQNAFDIAADQLKNETIKTSRPARTNHTSGISEPNQQKRCVKCSDAHHLRDCSVFKVMSVDGRLEFLRGNGICFSCLNKGHMSRKCRQSKVCGRNNCALRHHELLHQDRPAVNAASHHSSCLVPFTVALGTIAVTVFDSKGQPVKANLMFDECSDTTLVREGFRNRLGLTGELKTLTIAGVTGSRSHHQSRRVTIRMKTLDGGEVNVIASSVPKICDQLPAVPWNAMKRKWSHLSDLPLTETNGKIDILLGLDHGPLMLANDYRRGRDDEPYAIRTRLGWLARGLVAQLSPTQARINLTRLALEDSLDFQLRRFCDTESFGAESSGAIKLAPIDAYASRLVEVGTKQLDHGYEVALPWKEGEPKMPYNKKLAEHRLQHLQQRFNRDPDFKTDYFHAMQKYFEKGFAHVVTDPVELDHPQQSFLSHHSVTKANAEIKKVRIVFDSAARFEGKCLNDCLIVGPPLQNCLPHVLIRFREGDIAWVADIEAMYSRIRMTPDDARFHRFLWFDKNGKIVVCQMDRLTFGNTSSPFVALKTIRRVAADHGAGREDAVRAIHENLYVDDYLDSAKSDQEAITRAKEVRDILAAGDFPLVGWKSNSLKFLQALDPLGTPSQQIVTETPFEAGDSGTRVLGVNWIPDKDVLVFRFTIPSVTFTRRGLASLTAGIFDPIGILAPVTVKAKIRLREIAIRGGPWDDEVPEEDQRWWKNFVSRLPELGKYEASRSLFPDQDFINRTELHTFCDASEEAFAAVIYLRNVYMNGRILTRLVMAKSKLTPLKTISVAKNELNGALLGARLAAFVLEAISRPIHRRWFWTDSSCVRNWIRSTAAYYKPFVSQRVGEIQTLTTAEEWRFVPGKFNVADHATRSSMDGGELIEKTWFVGPEYLTEPEEHWPIDLPWTCPAEEIRPVHEHRIHLVSIETSIDWTKLELDPDATAGFTKMEGQLLNCIKKCQSDSFPTELRELQAGKNIARASKLLCLSPMLDPNGLLRVGGRIGKAELPYDNKHPVILPAKHPLTHLIVEEFHRRLFHTGVDHVLSHVRQHYWILKGREIVKNIRRQCRQCREEFARPTNQMMAELPKERLDFGNPPFYHTCVDYFGPLEVVYGRNRTAKRYGVLFACLVTRAVYLDLAQSLSSADFLLVYSRFTSMHGKPSTIWSDNGTNFVGAEREMKRNIEELSEDPQLKMHLARTQTTWRFQPPNAPHFGGAHESLVRSAKSALYRALKIERELHRLPSEEVLRTLLFQVADLLNGRPLTYPSSDPADLRPLTPNDFMNKPPSSIVPPAPSDKFALPTEGIKYVRRTLQLIWDLWRKHYLPSVITRKKWQVKRRNFQIGDAVMIAEKNVPVGKWVTGKVTAVHPGSDGLVRVVDVTTNDGTYRRPVHLLGLLEPSEKAVDPTMSDRGQDVPAN